MIPARVLWALARGKRATGNHAEDLERFYAGQAEAYDASRERMLHGRQQAVESLDVRPGARILDIGGGTGRNLEFLGARLADCASVEVIDCCASLLAMAERRVRERGWDNVTLTQADACEAQPRHLPVDRMLFSYSLSMIPDWRRVLDRAIAWLAPDGLVAVADFYLSRQLHGVCERWFWRHWFARCGVALHDDLLETLTAALQPVLLVESRGSLPGLPGLRAPYCVFIGRKRSSSPV